MHAADFAAEIGTVLEMPDGMLSSEATIVTTLAIKISADKADDALRLIMPMVHRSRTESGCLSCDVYRCENYVTKLVLVERWRSLLELKRHIQSARYRRVLAWMEMSVEPPEVRFETVSESRGLDMIEALRG
jgi:quinol monooxygenase YgiN